MSREFFNALAVLILAMGLVGFIRGRLRWILLAILVSTAILGLAIVIRA